MTKVCFSSLNNTLQIIASCEKRFVEIMACKIKKINIPKSLGKERD